MAEWGCFELEPGLYLQQKLCDGPLKMGVPDDAGLFSESIDFSSEPNHKYSRNSEIRAGIDCADFAIFLLIGLPGVCDDAHSRWCSSARKVRMFAAVCHTAM